MGITYRDEMPQSADDMAAALRPLLRKIKARLILEPGRFIVGNAGILVTEVLYIKDAGKKFVIVDAGMNDLLRPSLYDAYHEILPVHRLPLTVHRRWKADIVGPICESGDFLGKDRSMRPVSKGDLLAVMSAGAYGFSMASNYNARRRPAEALVSGGKFSVIRERESYRDLIKGEKIR